MRQLFNQIDEQGNIVLERVKLNPFMTLPAGHQWVPAPEYVPSQREVALTRIAELEAQITQRRLREAITTGNTSFLNGIEAQISALRNQL